MGSPVHDARIVGRGLHRRDRLPRDHPRQVVLPREQPHDRSSVAGNSDGRARWGKRYHPMQQDGRPVWPRARHVVLRRVAGRRAMLYFNLKPDDGSPAADDLHSDHNGAVNSDTDYSDDNYHTTHVVQVPDPRERARANLGGAVQVDIQSREGGGRIKASRDHRRKRDLPGRKDGGRA